MSKYEQINNLSEGQFRRLTGVGKTTFAKMLQVYENELVKSKKLSGRPAALSHADQILMCLEYNREYRTYFHISQSYGRFAARLSESAAYRSIRRVEELLIKSGAFSLPGKKALRSTENSFEVILIDATESRIERPKKTNAATILARKNSIISKHNW